jgi:membrane protease YdiL (CAAX protease family)
MTQGEADASRRRRDIDLWVILLSAPLLLTLWRYRGQAAQFPAGLFGLTHAPLRDLGAVLWQFASFFVLCGAVPLLFLVLRLRRPLAATGFGLGDRRFGLLACAAALPPVVLVAWLSSRMPDVRAEYPLLRLLPARHDLFPLHAAAYTLLYYVAWEFFFRGFLLFPLRDAFGGAAAVLIQTTSSCLVHLGKPEGEMLGSIPFGILIGLLALRTRSFWYGFVLHAALGILTDAFIVFGSGPPVLSP